MGDRDKKGGKEEVNEGKRTPCIFLNFPYNSLCEY